MLIIYLLSSIISKNFGIEFYTLVMIGSGILAGSIGGILGVNLK